MEKIKVIHYVDADIRSMLVQPVLWVDRLRAVAKHRGCPRASVAPITEVCEWLRAHLAQCDEWARRSNLPGVTKRLMHTSRETTAHLHRNGVQIGTRTEITHRKQIVGILFVLPPFEG